MVGQSHDSFTLMMVKDVISAFSAGYSSAVRGVQTGGTLKQTWVLRNFFFGVHE
jgi:hypothetical protein